MVTLYKFESEEIRVTIDARFEGNVLMIDGYDIGKTVEAYWGDSDYEYSLTIPPESVEALYKLLDISSGEQETLLNELARRYCTNSCFSDIRQLLDDNKISCEGFSWA